MIKIRDGVGNEVTTFKNWKTWSSKRIGGLCVGIDEENLTIDLGTNDFELSLKSGVGVIDQVSFSVISTETYLVATLVYEPDEEFLEIKLSK